MAGGLDQRYRKWDHIEVSDDEDDTHPNIDTPSLYRWRHQARVERMEQTQKEKDELAKEKLVHKKGKAALKEEMKATKETEREHLEKKLAELRRKDEELRRKDEDLQKKERLTPWNVDTLSKPGFERSFVNKQADPKELTEEEKQKKMFNFMEHYEKELKAFGVLKDYNASRDYLRDHPHLVCEDTGSYLTLWCIDLAVDTKMAIMERVAHQAIVMQYILEMARHVKRDPRSVVPAFFDRMKSAEKTYTEAFEDEFRSFIGRVKGRAQARLEEAQKKAEEEERKQRLGPGGLDPIEVIETLPLALRECFESKDVARLQTVLIAMTPEDRTYHMKRCVDSGLWVSDAKSVGLTPANEIVKDFGKKLQVQEEQEEGAEADGDTDEFYEAVEEEEGIHSLD